MRFFHLSDLHLGKQLHGYSLLEDQRHILREITEYAKKLRPDAVVIAGDIYDKSVPSAEAVTLFDDFLTELATFESMAVFIISGNHDSASRLEYAGRLLGQQGIYIAGHAAYLKKVTLTDAFGEVDFYLLPFLKPGYVRHLFENENIETYSDAVRLILEKENIDTARRTVLISHQFYTGNGETPAICDSELFSVGGIDNVDTAVLPDFDYVALGHLHGAQQVGQENVRYCGTPLKYSVSEAAHVKSLYVVELGKKDTPAVVTTYPLHPLRDVRVVRGTLQEIIAQAAAGNRNDYISVTLTDETEPYKPKEQLEQVYSHILEIRVDNARTRKRLEEFDEEIHLEDPVSMFAEFYQEIQERELTEAERIFVMDVWESVKEENR